MIVDKDAFKMPGKDRPPQSFMRLRTQQGQINWLAQFLMSVNQAFDGLNVTATIETGEEMGVTTEYVEDTNTLVFHFVFTGSGGSGYVLPTMSAEVKGGAKVGSGLAIANDVLSVDASTINQGILPVAQGGTGATTESVSRARFGSIPLGRCPSAPTNTNKIVDNTTFNDTTNQLYAGARVSVTFANYAENAELCTFYLSGAQYPIWINGAPTSAANPLIISKGAIAEFIFDGSKFHYLGNNIDGYQDYEANQAIADNAAAIATLQEFKTGSMVASSLVTNVEASWYVRVGRVVTFYATFTCNTTSMENTSELFSGLPSPYYATTRFIGMIITGAANSSDNGKVFRARIANGAISNAYDNRIINNGTAVQMQISGMYIMQ